MDSIAADAVDEGAGVSDAISRRVWHVGLNPPAGQLDSIEGFGSLLAFLREGFCGSGLSLPGFGNSTKERVRCLTQKVRTQKRPLFWTEEEELMIQRLVFWFFFSLSK